MSSIKANTVSENIFLFVNITQVQLNRPEPVVFNSVDTLCIMRFSFLVGKYVTNKRKYNPVELNLSITVDGKSIVNIIRLLEPSQVF